MPTRFGWLLSFCLLLPCMLSGFISETQAAKTEGVFVQEVQGTGASSAEDENAIHQLLKIAVNRQKGHRVVEDPSEAAFELRPRIIRLGGSNILALEKIREGRVVYADQMKTLGLHEMDKVTMRLVRSVIEEDATEAKPKVGEVTKSETTPEARHEARAGYYLGFGPAVTDDLGAESLGVHLAGGYGWSLENVVFRLGADLTKQGSAYFATAGLGGNFFITNDVNAPFILAEFGYGFAAREDDAPFGNEESQGFAAGIGAGFQFLRTSSINLETSLKAGMIFDQNTEGTPKLLALRISLYF